MRLLVSFRTTNRRFVSVLFVHFCLFSNIVFAEAPVYEIRIKDHLFHPSRLEIPVNQKVKLLVLNEDSTPEEFESYELNREKVIMGASKGVIFIGPLRQGIYPFFGEFNPLTAQGTIEVK